MARERQPDRKRTTVEEQEARVKQPLVGVFLGYPLYDEVKAAAQMEPVRGMGAFVMEVFRYGWTAYREIGSLKAMKAGTPVEKRVRGGGRVSEETHAILVEALEMILERAPSTVIEELTRYVTSRAGKYAESKKK